MAFRDNIGKVALKRQSERRIMGLVKTRRLAAMQKQQRAKAGMKPPVYKDLRKGDFRSRQDVDGRRAGAAGRIAR